MTHTDTERQIFSMLTENTGIALCDSGGYGGRMWQRNQAAVAGAEDPLALWKQREEIICDKYGMVLIDLFHYLRKRLEFRPDLTRRLYRWDNWVDPRHDLFWGGQIEEWLSKLAKRGWIEREHSSGYTYNFENLLSQDIIYYEFEVCDGPLPVGEFVVLQIHNGADARGGFTAPAIFERITEGFLYDCQDYSCWCPNTYELAHPGQLRLDGTEDDTMKCSFAFEIVGGYPDDREGSPLSKEDIDRGDDDRICPKCGATLQFAAPDTY